MPFFRSKSGSRIAMREDRRTPSRKATRAASLASEKAVAAGDGSESSTVFEELQLPLPSSPSVSQRTGGRNGSRSPSMPPSSVSVPPSSASTVKAIGRIEHKSLRLRRSISWPAAAAPSAAELSRFAASLERTSRTAAVADVAQRATLADVTSVIADSERHPATLQSMKSEAAEASSSSAAAPPQRRSVHYSDGTADELDSPPQPGPDPRAQQPPRSRKSVLESSAVFELNETRAQLAQAQDEVRRLLNEAKSARSERDSAVQRAHEHAAIARREVESHSELVVTSIRQAEEAMARRFQEVARAIEANTTERVSQMATQVEMLAARESRLAHELRELKESCSDAVNGFARQMERSTFERLDAERARKEEATEMRALVGQLLQMGEAVQQAAATAAADAADARTAAFAASPAAPSQPALLPHNPPSHSPSTSVGMAAAHSTMAGAVFNAPAALVSLARLAAMCVVNVLMRTTILTSNGQAATPSSPATPELHKAIGSPPDLPAPSPSLSPPAILCTAPDVSQPRALHKDLLAEISSAGGSPMRLRSGSNGSSFKTKPSPLGSPRSGAEPNIVEVLANEMMRRRTSITQRDDSSSSLEQDERHEWKADTEAQQENRRPTTPEILPPPPLPRKASGPSRKPRGRRSSAALFTTATTEDSEPPATKAAERAGNDIVWWVVRAALGCLVLVSMSFFLPLVASLLSSTGSAATTTSSLKAVADDHLRRMPVIFQGLRRALLVRDGRGQQPPLGRAGPSLVGQAVQSAMRNSRASVSA